MNEQLKRLIALQRLDTLILSTILRMDSIPAAIASHEAPLREAEAVYEKARQEYAALEKSKREKEGRIQDLQEKIGKMRQRGAEIKTNKEFQAHGREIEKAEADLKSTEDALLSVMTSLDAIDKTVAAGSSRVADEKKRIDEIRAELEEEVGRCGEELKKLKSDRKIFVEKVDTPLYGQYMLVMKACRGVALAEAKNEICQGCSMRIPPQLFVEIKTNDSIVPCPQCRRILYFPSPEALS